MALVEAIARELVDQIEQLVRRLGVDVIMFAAALHEGIALRVHLGLDLLAHRAAQQIRAAKAVAGEDLRRLHHLFLIDENAIGFGENAFEQADADRRSPRGRSCARRTAEYCP
jgi:hypothetical protein